MRRGAAPVLEDLRVILDAEAEARRQFDAARAHVADLLRQAEEEAQRSVRQAQAARDTDAEAVEARLLAEAQQQANRILATAEATAAALQTQAAAHVEQAVDALVQAVLAPPSPAAAERPGGPGSR
jgi:vacuolar-type H+-ATPase subunit H